MKRIFSIVLVAIVAMVASQQADAQFRFGVKGALSVNSLHYSFGNGDSKAGYNVGVMAEVGVPILGGFYIDGSLLWAHRPNEASVRNYLDIPLNLKYKFGIPAVGKVFKPYLCTGPEFGYMLNNTQDYSPFKKFSSNWNIGAGVELFSHLQVQVQYAFGMTDVYKNKMASDRLWTISAAYLF